MSWPRPVVPSRWLVDGPSRGAKMIAVGSSFAITPGNAPTRQKSTSSPKPTLAFLLDLIAVAIRSRARAIGLRARPPIPGNGLSRPWPVTVASDGIWIIAILASAPRPGVEQRGRDIRNQDRDQHGDGDQQEQRLH